MRKVKLIYQAINGVVVQIAASPTPALEGAIRAGRRLFKLHDRNHLWFDDPVKAKEAANKHIRQTIKNIESFITEQGFCGVERKKWERVIAMQKKLDALPVLAEYQYGILCEIGAAKFIKYIKEFQQTKKE